MSKLSDALEHRADPSCPECLGHGSHTCTVCEGSGADPGCNPVFDQFWRRCRRCVGHGWTLCLCLDRPDAPGDPIPSEVLRESVGRSKP